MRCLMCLNHLLYRHRHITSKEVSRDDVLVLVEEGCLVERKLACKAIGETDFDWRGTLLVLLQNRGGVSFSLCRGSAA